MEQTAVEWLEIEIKKQIFQCEDQWQCGYQKALNEVVFLLKQAKEMEKQQMKMAQMHYSSDVIGFKTLLEKQFEEWYNETFKSK